MILATDYAAGVILITYLDERAGGLGSKARRYMRLNLGETAEAHYVFDKKHERLDWHWQLYVHNRKVGRVSLEGKSHGSYRYLVLSLWTDDVQNSLTTPSLGAVSSAFITHSDAAGDQRILERTVGARYKEPGVEIIPADVGTIATLKAHGLMVAVSVIGVGMEAANESDLLRVVVLRIRPDRVLTEQRTTSR